MVLVRVRPRRGQRGRAGLAFRVRPGKWRFDRIYPCVFKVYNQLLNMRLHH